MFQTLGENCNHTLEVNSLRGSALLRKYISNYVRENNTTSKRKGGFP